jgi:murein DD-endopeptidase MepM/ murein hydrolase activator NlpD
MLSVSDQCNGTGTRTASNRSRWLFAIAVFAIGIVPMCQIAKAVGPSPACSGATYSVVSGDSWSRIASRSNVTMTALMNANGATTATVIHPGQTLCLPGSTAPAATTTTTTAATTTTTATTVVTPPAAPAAPAATASVAINQFPVQGPCSFGDTYGAPRSGGRFHEGVDIIAKAGQWIYAVQDGTLTKKYLDIPGSLSGNGWRLTVAGGTYFFYAHLSAFAPGLSVGSAVKAGQIIGQVGMTGDAPIPHLHFEVHPGGGASVNPTPVVRAVDGCKNTAVPPQPDGSVPATAPPTTTVPATTVPATTVPGAPPTTVFTPPPAHRRDIAYVPGVVVRPRRVVPPTG